MIPPPVASLIFYLLVVLAWLVLRGSVTPWAAMADRLMAFVLLMAGLLAWAFGWRSRQPAARPLGRAFRADRWLLASSLVLGAVVLLALFAGPLPMVSQWIAQPPMQQPAETGEAPSPEPPPISSATPQTPGPGPAGDGDAPAAASTAEEPQAKQPQSFLQRSQEWLRRQPRWALIVFLIALLGLIGWLLGRVFRNRPADSEGAATVDGGTILPNAPRYLRDFRKLCVRRGCPVERGDTLRQLLARLGSLGHDVSPFASMENYHYAVTYAGAAARPAEEKGFRRTIRRLR